MATLPTISTPSSDRASIGTASRAQGGGNFGLNFAANARQRAARDEIRADLLRAQEMQSMLGQQNIRSEMIREGIDDINNADTPTSGQVAQSAAVRQLLGQQQPEGVSRLNQAASVTNQRQNVADVANTNAQTVSSMADAGQRGPDTVTFNDLRTGELGFMFDPRSLGTDQGQTAAQQAASSGSPIQVTSPVGPEGFQFEGEARTPQQAQELRQSLRALLGMRGDTGAGVDQGQTRGGQASASAEFEPILNTMEQRGLRVNRQAIEPLPDGRVIIQAQSPQGENYNYVYDRQQGQFVGIYDENTGEVELFSAQDQ